MEIYVSSLAFAGSSIEEILDLCHTNDLALEFSSGLPFRRDMQDIYIHAPIKRIPHNYFPAPQEAFVLNLASTNQVLRENSIKHCLQGLDLAKRSGSPFFSAHAGFCIDPNPEELGNKIRLPSTFDKSLCKELFIESVRQIMVHANKIGISFLIENNVIAQFNLGAENVNPLLCCTGEEINWLVSEINQPNFGILLDTAHLKVSCITFNVDLHQELKLIMPHIKCIHHSDNDGLIDDNKKFTNDYWFLKYMVQFEEIPHVIEVKNITTKEIASLKKILINHGN
ncbi:TIM barrel protein [Parapedobacter sp. ISTM3]|uniref:sugar phosphate isomerase/epimerase family protein n=1 Tax=Parapedobacter sp. ISTM3 TaxID=2800130 RepID=UPI0019033365|nr:TIM barrel protein [Parapedobacter sp. ISTM3]MBK1438368.1 TIM barrel protein [Parapedobacter sp. ISTM3]